MPAALPVAVVVGLCGHGLAIVRALHHSGIKVEALETNLLLPGIRTCCANVRKVTDINNAGLIDSLLALSSEIGTDPLPVLILTNDRMVETVAQYIEQLYGRFALSWSKSHRHILRLLNKDQIETRCRETDLNYPRTVIFDRINQFSEQVSNLRLCYPLIVKPVRPLSSFKTLVIQSADDFPVYYDQIASSLPVIVQEFISGDDGAIRFGALYLDQGQILGRFEGRKLRSQPMGHTTLAVSEPNDEVYRLVVRFFNGLALSGPVSLELKQAPDGSLWVIEPTVGRTDFWVGLCIANGVNLPLIEYRSQTGLLLPETRQGCSYLWVNGERDRFVLFWLAFRQPWLLFSRRITALYFDLSDIRPFLGAVSDMLLSLPSRVSRKIARKIGYD